MLLIIGGGLNGSIEAAVTSMAFFGLEMHHQLKISRLVMTSQCASLSHSGILWYQLGTLNPPILLHQYIPLHEHSLPCLIPSKSWLSLSTVFKGMPNAPLTVYAVIKLQDRRSVGSAFHKICVTLQSWCRKKESHFQSSSLREMTPFLTPSIQHGFWVGVQTWTFDQLSALMLLYLIFPSMSAKLKASQKPTRISCKV